MATECNSTSEEEWRDVPGWEGLYQASSFGRVRSLDREQQIRNRWGPITRVVRGRVLTGALDKGYRVVLLSDRERTYRTSVHRIVCSAFHGSPDPSRPVVAHTDGCRTNNRPENLRWTTQVDNIADMESHGTKRVGEDIWHTAKLTEAKVLQIRALAASTSTSKLARDFGVSAVTIAQVVKRRTWKHI